jgi:hypothetical protein
LSRRREDRCRFASVVSCGCPRPMYAIYGVLYRVATFSVGCILLFRVALRGSSTINIKSSLRLESSSFRGCDLGSCNLVAETNNFGLCAFLLSCLVSELQHHLHR